MPAVTSTLPAPRWTTYVRLSDLRPAVRNPKEHDLAAVVNSVARHGFTVPVLVCGRTERIAAGHGRLAALVHLKSVGARMPDGLVVDEDGEWCVPVVRGWESRNDVELEAYVIRDNQTTIGGGWDDRLLATTLHDILGADPALFDELGFSEADMHALMESIDPDRFDADPDHDGPAFGGDSDDTGGGGKPHDAECPNCGHRFALGVDR